MSKHVFFYPDYSGGNPYQKLLYQSSKDRGDIIQSANIERALDFIQQHKNQKVVFHMHWLNALWNNCKSDKESWIVLNDFMSNIRLFQKCGGRVVWTIHNHLPHENNYSEQDFRLRCFLCKYADRIHLHCASHIYELDYLPLNIEKIFIQRHGSYLGYYGKFSISDKIASFDTNNLTAVFVGMLRGYKNVDKLLEIASSLSNQGVKVSIVGKPDSKELESRIANYCSSYNINHILRRVTEQEIHEICVGADIGIVSYDKILTSGTLKLYMSYGMQIIAPNLHTINIEDRYNTFVRYDPDVNTKFFYKIQDKAEYTKSFILSYFLARELDWESKLLDFE